MSEITQRKRCAVYTRKSHEEGLDQDYNSIDAQKDAGHAFIQSQRHEGWIPVLDDYDDPAYSGGNIERPALQRLMHDIEAGLIDIVVVYKIDRLTRSLFDFSRLVEVFEQYNVSFVSVTQQFNTTNSMGRLMLNILLSFAQFEREVTGERIRDKVAASRKKGLWTGGNPPLGYDVEDKKLVINKDEATIVKHIFERFVEVKSATKLVKELALDNIRTKVRNKKNGETFGGNPIDKGFLYKLLNNRTYIGDIKHKDKWYPGVQKPILDDNLWICVQEILRENYRSRGNKTRAKVHFLLKGLLFDENGRALTTYSTVKPKSGKRYRYYLSTVDQKEHAGASGLPRFSAGELESTVLKEMLKMLQTPDIVAQVVTAAQEMDDSLDEAQVTVAMTQVEKIWTQLFPEEQTRITKLLVDKVIVYPENLQIYLHKTGIGTLARELAPQQ